MSAFNVIMALSGAADIDVTEAEPLRRHTTYRIGGPAALFLTCHSYHGLRRAVEILEHEHMEWVILGKGSNLLVSDEGYDGAVITLGREFSRFVTDPEACTISAGAGALLSRVVNEAYTRGLTGLEACVGIPGTLGGAVSMNAGSRDEWIGARVDEIRVFSPAERRLKRYGYEDITWGYRQTSIPRGEIVLEAKLHLEPEDKAAINARMEKSLARRRRTQPVGAPSCGSVFRNPAGMHVGKMIEDCGLKGFSIGGAQVSPVHANFIVNTGNARAEDVVRVIQHVHATVREAYGVELQPEVKFLGF